MTAPDPRASGDAGDFDCDVLILGASFAGIEVHHQLRRRRAGRELSIIVVDRQAEHGYIPLVQERLTGRLPLAASALPTARCVAADPRSRYVVDEVERLDPETHEVHLASGARLRGRFIVVALGSLLAPPPGLPGREHLLGYKLAREFAAAQTELLAQLQPPRSPHLIVIGGGISGVELAGDLAHLARHARHTQPGVVPPRVTLIDGGDRLLRGLTERAGRMARARLERQGVALRLRTRVLGVTPDSVELQAREGEPERISHDGAFWAGGLRPAAVLPELGLPRTPHGWLAVGPTLQCFATTTPTHPQIFACGDAARVIGGDGEWPTMWRAIECLWQAKVVARNILALAEQARDSVAPPGAALPTQRALAQSTPLHPHSLTRDFPHGVSIGAASMIVFGPLALELGILGVWFRRFLMHMYFRRYGKHRV